MSDLFKAQATPHFNWYTCWTSLGANVMPDKLIKEDLKQPDQIKISFEKLSKDITGHIVPDQVQFGPNYFLMFTLPDFKSKILTQFLQPRAKTVQHCSACWASVSRTLVSQSGQMLWVNNAPIIRTSQRKTLTSASGTTSRLP
jgi:hypothetical protein